MSSRKRKRQAEAAVETLDEEDNEPPKVIGVFFSTGDLGDVGRHVVAAALEFPPFLVSIVRVFSSNPETLFEENWKCGCGSPHAFSQQDRRRLQIVKLDCTRDPIEEYMGGLDAVVSCLGNRKPFHPDCIAKLGTERICQAMIKRNIERLVLLSSVGIAEDWPPMEWCQDGTRLQGFFRTICWGQYQDLSGAEKAVRQTAEIHPGFDYLIVRSVLLNETTPPAHQCYRQKRKFDDHPVSYIAKFDCAEFLFEQSIYPTLHRCAIVIGGMPKLPPAGSSAKGKELETEEPPNPNVKQRR